MALHMLVGGSDCGPSNPLQTLTKRFDHDRGLKQDYFNPSTSSREAFRTVLSGSPAASQDAAQFFAASPAANITAATGFDLTTLRNALPATHGPISVSPNPIVDWASDFTQSQGIINNVKSDALLRGNAPELAVGQQQVGPPVTQVTQGGLQWNSMMAGVGMNPMAMYNPQSHVPVQAQPKRQLDEMAWDREFASQEQYKSTLEALEPQVRPSDELARTAAMLLEQVKDERNPKFKESQFMNFMRQLRDGMVTVEDNQVVETREVSASRVDAKGKGRSVDTAGFAPMRTSQMAPRVVTSEDRQVASVTQEDANDIYFRQENEDYIQYWADQDAAAVAPTVTTFHTQSEWDKLQEDWDQFEATSTGMREVDLYQFQTNNPYLVGDSSRLKTTRDRRYQSTIESVLELEAAVQRDLNSAMAWYHLGVKQQENEREHKALQALKRAVELDPTHLHSWLALAVSYANDGKRAGAYDAISEWLDRNEKYKSAVLPASAHDADASPVQRYEVMINRLITVARSNADGEIDADIQIALAVLLNANEDYGKAQDCFRTALALRPDDWSLYNRVGATMANSGRAEEALEYYYKALELNPGYIRARYNLGISCTNLRQYEEAGHHILDALVLQENDGTSGLNKGITSSALWDSLKTVCLHMQRLDLATLCDRRDLDNFRFTFQMVQQQ